jgi:maleate isomerase
MALRFSTDGGAGEALALGLVVLHVDETIEQDFRRLMPLEAALYTSRVPSGAEVTAETLARMEADLPAAVGRLPPAAGLHVVGYACTSGTTIIGEEGVARAVRSVRPGVAVTNPLTAAKAAFTALGARRIAFISPYVAEVSAAIRAKLEEAGFAIAAVGSFEQAEERVVARIDTASVLAAIEDVGGGAEECDAVFVSCTNLRVLDVLEEAESRIGKPVVSSNTALAWHMLRLAGCKDVRVGGGRLFRTELP